MNIVLIENDDKTGVTAHAEGCPEVEAHRAAGRPLITLFDLQKAMPDDMPVHDCLIPDDTPVHSCLKRVD